MRRFLDWTAAQSGVNFQTPPANQKRVHSLDQSTNPSHHYQYQQQQSSTTNTTNPTMDLEVQHLIKLLHEIKYYQASSSPLPSASGSRNQIEFIEKLNKTLPLFINIFGTNLPQSQSSIQTSTNNDGRSNAIPQEQYDSSCHVSSNLKPSSPQPTYLSPRIENHPVLLPFATTLARLFVSEIRQRASNKHAEDASIAILKFINFGNQLGNYDTNLSTQESIPNATLSSENTTSPGWNLLLSLNILAFSNNSQIIQLLCDASLPSTLIKCLYLFFDLPTSRSNLDQSESFAPSSTSSTSSSSSSSCANVMFASEMTNGPLCKAFTRLLVQLCSYQAAIDELIRKDDLRLLIGIASTQCSPQNRAWRKTAFQALLSISKNMRENFLYLEQNLCIQVYIENMYRINSLGLVNMDELIDMIKILNEFLYNLDVCNRDQPRCIVPLIEQYSSSRIVDLIEELILKIDEIITQDNQTSMYSFNDIDPLGCPVSQQPSVSSETGNCVDEHRRYGKRLIQSLTTMAMINISHEAMTNISLLKPLAMSRFEMLEQFKMPRPSAKNCLLNFDAIRLFKMSWSKCHDPHLIEAVLDATITLFNEDKFNYFIFESQQLLVYYITSQNFHLFSFKVKQKLFKFLEFIIIETNYIPCLELGTLGTLIKRKLTSDIDKALGLKTLIACLRFNAKFSDIFREIGLLEVIIELLIETMQDESLTQHNIDKLEVLYLLLEASQHSLVGPNNANCVQFNESGAARYVFNCLSKPKFFQLFVPAHSSSSDDSTAPIGSTSRNSTPTPTRNIRFRQLQSSNYRHKHQHQSWTDVSIARAQNKPSIKQMQRVAFTIIRQLILSSAGDEHLANLLGLLARNLDDLKYLGAIDNCNSSTNDIDANNDNIKTDMTFLLSQEVNLKICILKSLMIILKDSHRCKALFRKVGGFIYIVSSLVILEKSLPIAETSSNQTFSEAQNVWKKVNGRRIWRLIKNCLMTIVVAMRSQPISYRVFSDEVIGNFTNALRKLGCFKADQINMTSSTRPPNQPITSFESFRSIFLAPPSRDFSTISNENIQPNEACCQLFRFLYDMSLDMGDGTPELELHIERQASIHESNNRTDNHDIKSISFDQDISTSSSSVLTRRSHLHRTSLRLPSLDLKGGNIEPTILTFPSIIITMLDLIPSCPSEDLIIFITMVIKSLFRHERNQSLLCEAGMISKLLEFQWRITITDKTHYLHDFVEFLLEKLNRQLISSKELRTFLRLGDPLYCKNLDEIRILDHLEDDQVIQSIYEQNKVTTGTREKIKVDRLKTFVNMLNDKPINQPPYIEFDISTDGCSFIFMPSIAPVNTKTLPPNSSSFLNSTLDIHTSEKNGILGGVGSNERIFPPITGLTFSTWICIECFPARSSDSNQNLRLLTIYRGSAATGKEYSCFRVQISALDRSLSISTQEVPLFDFENRTESQMDSDYMVKVWTPELLTESKWHHIAITMNRSLVKQSTIHVYLDGALVHSQKICYISSYVGLTNSGPLGNSASNSSSGSPAAFVNAFIGSLPQFRGQQKTLWKQGPCHLMEEQLSINLIGVIYSLGPSYIGNFQSSSKLSEIVRNTAPLEKKRNKSDAHQSHKALVHQQSVNVVQTPRAYGASLTRVSSSGVGLNSGNQYNLAHTTSTSPSSSQGLLAHFNISEDKVLMSIDARATSLISLTRMRRIYNRFDCRQVNRVLGLSPQDNSIPILLLHNTGIHLNGPSRGIGAITIGYNQVRCFVPNPTEQTIFNIGGCYILLGFVAQAQTNESFILSLRCLVHALRANFKLQAQMDNINGYQILSMILGRKKQLICKEVLELVIILITDKFESFDKNRESSTSPEIKQIGALRELICESFDLWLEADMINLVLEFIYNLINSNNNNIMQQQQQQVEDSFKSTNSRAKNLKYLREMDLLPRMLKLLSQYDLQQQQQIPENESVNLQKPNKDFDAKAVYLIKQTVFELLNRTSRQSDILYFGQFLASLLPSKQNEKHAHTISLRNILLKSLLQMMTKNKQNEVNNAMQEELVRILGFDWFMLFISGSYLDDETITIGFLNLMIILSNEDLYNNFKLNASTNGGWLKEPTFPSMDSRFNIQLLGINVGMFYGLDSKRKFMKQNILEAPNFFLFVNFLSNLTKMPRIYLMIFLTMMNRITRLDSSVMDTIKSFDTLNLDNLCDCLVGDTHHKRRLTLSNTQFRCYELVVCIIYMLKVTMLSYEGEQQQKQSTSTSCNKLTYEDGEAYPNELIKFLMYLYNNNQEFQNYCRNSDDLIIALSETLMKPSNNYIDNGSNDNQYNLKQMTLHPASKEILELSRLIVLDKMTEISSPIIEQALNDDQLNIFEKFLHHLKACKEARNELVELLLRQILLMIDSTARHNSIKTISGSDNVLQFQLLLVNSILANQIVTDKIWSYELFQDNLARINAIIDHQLCLAEQIYKFNELLPKHNPPHAFIMQRVLNRTIIFALSRPIQHISDRIQMLDLLKKIYDNRTIIILNHMHSPQSAEFFVCLTFNLMKIIEDNSNPVNQRNLNEPSASPSEQPLSLIERQYGHPSPGLNRESLEPSSSSIMLASMARKVWDSVYQSKKGILSEALDVSLSLPAFTLETSLDLLSLKPDINETCSQYWSNFLESEQKPKKRVQQRQSEPNSGNTATSNAVNILSGRLTRVVNAASFVSRVVGATAGSMASNVNLVGEKLTQNRSSSKRDQALRSTSDSSLGSQQNISNLLTQQASSNALNANNSSSTDRSYELFRCQSIDQTKIEEACKMHISIIEDHIRMQLSQKNHKLALHKYLYDEWLDTEDEILLRERAIFGPEYGSDLDKWCLDMTEGPRRMCKKMINYTKQFYANYPYRAEQYNPSNKSLRYRPPMSYDSRMYYLKTIDFDKHLLEPIENCRKITENQPLKEQNSSDNFIDSKNDSEDKKSVTSIKSDFDTATDANLNSGKSDIDLLRQQPEINIEHKDSIDQSAKVEVSTGLIPKQKSTSTDSFRSQTNDTSDHKPSSSPLLPMKSGDLDDGDTASFVDFSPEIEAETNLARESENLDSLSVLRLLEKNERITHMFRCSRVQGLDTYEGLLLFGREHFYLIDGFTLLKTREIKDIDSLPPDAHDPIIPNSTPNILALSKKKCSKFSYDSIIEVHKRRYLLQPIALEVFSSDGRNTLIVFPRNIRNKVYGRLMSLATQITSNAQDSLAGQKSNVSVEGGSGLLSNLIGETSVTQRWVRGELSNFQYLMNLNTIAGRSYNDLMQYPIFPWILSDYTSDYLDLTKPTTFRDLSRPVGAQTYDRLEQFKRRYIEWDDSETPPYHYGTFYSSAMIVASYMVRMEPFTQHFLRLQGGHFDLADRMFHSIQDSWLSASKHNMADIKELIPEFFYLPEFLKNENKYDLGIKQNGMKLDDVILPPWAKNDCREFIRLHRCALESDYVSAHLNEWIDLIFGYKQQGQAAIDAVNVFHHLFYEGNVDIYNTDIDPIKKNAIIGFINNFGQVPKQLFKKPHPVRKVMTSSSTNYISGTTSIPLTPILPSLSNVSNSPSLQKLVTHSPHLLRQINSNIKDLRGPVGQIIQIDRNVVAVEQNKLLIPPEYCRYVAWGHADRSLRLGLYDSEKPVFVWEGNDFMAANEILCCTIPNSRIMITAGTESLITVWRIDKMRTFSPILNLYGHVEPVTCLASSQSYSLVVSGSRDRTAIIWDLNRFKFVRQLGGGPNEQLVHAGPISAISINDSTGDIATCASSWLYLWTINGQLLAQVDSFSVTIQQTMSSSSGAISSGSTKLTNLSQLHLLSVCFSQNNEWDLDEVIITGASDGTVAIWSLRYYQCPMSKAEIEAQEKKQQSEKHDCDLETKLQEGNDDLEENQEERQKESGGDYEDQESEIYKTTKSRKKRSKELERQAEIMVDCNERQDNEFTSPNCDDLDKQESSFEQSNVSGASTSEPIPIRHRKRTDTMNSEWVRLSDSCNSTCDSTPVIRAATPTSLHDFMASGDSSFNQSSAGSPPPLPLKSTSALFGPTTPTSLEAADGSSRDLSMLTIANNPAAASLADLTNSVDGAGELLVGAENQPSLLTAPNDPASMKFSKSDTSLVDSFVILGESSVSPNSQQQLSASQSHRGGRPHSSAGGQASSVQAQKARKGFMSRAPMGGTQHHAHSRSHTSSKLLPNHTWKRELYLRCILPRRGGKVAPSAVTSLAISSNHRTLYVGETTGRITSWSTNY